MRSRVSALAAALSCAALQAQAADPASGVLTVQASGFTHARGHAIAKLFAPGDNVLGAGHWQANAPIEGGAAQFHFEALPAGRYAVVVFHDENDNATIDHGLFGPSEPIGFSGGFRLSLISGRPDFERLAFEFKTPAQTLEVRVQ